MYLEAEVCEVQAVRAGPDAGQGMLILVQAPNAARAGIVRAIATPRSRRCASPSPAPATTTIDFASSPAASGKPRLGKRQ